MVVFFASDFVFCENSSIVEIWKNQSEKYINLGVERKKMVFKRQIVIAVNLLNTQSKT